MTELASDRDWTIDVPERARTDGGHTTRAGTTTPDASALSSFLDEYSDAPGYEVTYAEGDTEVTRLLHQVSRHATTFERPSTVPAIQCTPLHPGEDRFTVGVDDVEHLAVVDPPLELYTADARTPRETATGLKRLAETDPSAVSIPGVLDLLDRCDETTRSNELALEALRAVAADRPEDCTPAIPLLRDVLDRDDRVRGVPAALGVLRVLGDDAPGNIAPLTDVLVPYLTAKHVRARYEASRCLASVAEADPSDALEAIPGLATVIEDDARGRAHAVYALSKLAGEYPGELKPFTDTLGELLLDDSLPDVVRSNAASALGRITGEYPDAALDLVDEIPALFEAENHKLRNNAIALFADIATVHTHPVEPYVTDVAPLLDADDTYTRINASGVSSRIAEDYPGSVEHLTETFVALLDDEAEPVRKNAAWTLGHLQATDAKAPLEECVREDGSPEVRERAAWAVAEIEPLE